MTEPDIYDKLSRFCGYQERTIADVKKKLYALKVEKDNYAEYIEKLQADNFLSEDRFVKSFVNGHLRKKWGTVKIKSALFKKQVPETLIKKYLQGVEDDDYREKLEKLATDKIKRIKADTPQAAKVKLQRFLMSKGYTLTEINVALAKMRKG
jgi:regulatory protein